MAASFFSLRRLNFGMTLLGVAWLVTGAYSAPISKTPLQHPISPPTATVEGQVEGADAGQLRLADWTLMAVPQPIELPPIWSGNSWQPLSKDGKFRFEGLPPGPTYICLYYKARLDVGSIQRLDLKPGEKRRNIALKPQPPRPLLAIHLLKAARQPLGHQVEAHLFNPYFAVDGYKGTLSDENGVVTFTWLPAGTYDLWLESPQAPRTARSAVDLPATIFHGLVVTSGRGDQRMELKLPESGGTQGHLQLPDGKTPAQGYTVAIQSGTRPLPTTPRAATALSYAQGAHDCYAETKVGPDGSFVLHGLTTGTQQLDIRRPGERVPWSTIPVVPVRAGEAMSIGTWAVPKNGWQLMFDGKALKNWKPSEFEGRSEVRIENGAVMLPQGNDMTGVTYTGELPHLDYEVSLEAMRTEGHDFFCGLTFPVEDAPCSLILGGWGGTVVGLSNVDGLDASENETTKTMDFEDNHWYRIRLRVTRAKLEAWVDNEKMVDLDRADKKFSIRFEVEASQPFGIATWRTSGAIRDIRIRRLDSPTAP